MFDEIGRPRQIWMAADRLSIAARTKRLWEAVERKEER
jgi:hypothetical protein